MIYNKSGFSVWELRVLLTVVEVVSDLLHLDFLAQPREVYDLVSPVTAFRATFSSPIRPRSALRTFSYTLLEERMCLNSSLHELHRALVRNLVATKLSSDYVVFVSVVDVVL